VVLCHNGQDITGINGGRPFLLVNCVREYKEVVKFSGNSLVHLLLLWLALQPTKGFSLLSDSLPFCSFFTLLSPQSYSHYLHIFFDIYKRLIPVICISSSISTTVLFPLFAYLLRYRQPSYSRYLHIFFDIWNRLIPIICISSSISTVHLLLGLPLILVPIGFHYNILLGSTSTFLLWRCDPTRVMVSLFLRFLYYTKRRTTVGRTPLNEWSAHRKDLYLTTLTTDKHPCPRWDSNPQS